MVLGALGLPRDGGASTRRAGVAAGAPPTARTPIGLMGLVADVFVEGAIVTSACGCFAASFLCVGSAFLVTVARAGASGRPERSCSSTLGGTDGRGDCIADAAARDAAAFDPSLRGGGGGRPLFLPRLPPLARSRRGG